MGEVPAGPPSHVYTLKRRPRVIWVAAVLLVSLIGGNVGGVRETTHLEELWPDPEEMVKQMEGLISQNNTSNEMKVLIIGIDGVRGDVAQDVAEKEDSTFGSIMEEGAWSFNVDVGPYAVSGPGWASMLTGVWCDRHGVVDNTFRGSQLESVPDLFEFIENHDQNQSTAAVYRWEPIDEHILGEGSADRREGYDTDEKVRDRAVELLTDEPDLDVLFVSMDDVDATGHDEGFSPDVPEYVAAVERAENMTADILDALGARDQSQEAWLVIITSDHGGGGRFLKMHHPSTPIDRNTFMLVTGGSAIQGEMTNDPVIIDVAVMALNHLEVPLPEGEEALDGRNSAFDSTVPPAREPTCEKPIFYYRVDLMAALVGTCCLSICAGAIFITVRLRKQRQGRGRLESMTHINEDVIPADVRE